ncbi:MPA43 (YNL249C) [Zygosaccharomyces parabailii]|nr:MPA43 (YNL249C) [Zygosaccharomyces parabailii]
MKKNLRNQVEAGIGIDLGSSSVRVGLFNFQNNTLIDFKVKQVSYYFNPESTNWKYTQSSREILDAIEQCLTELITDKYQIKSCGVGATCSMVLFKKKDTSLLPWNFDSHHKNVVFWMDSIAITESQELNQICKPEIRASMGGSFVPEMGIPKLKHLINLMERETINLSIEVFDLHRYIGWHLAKKFQWDYHHLCNSPNLNGIGHDGELAGWSPTFYEEVVKLPPNITIGPTDTNKLPNTNSTNIATCIDCYANWFALLSPRLKHSLFIVGGTSTCYLYASTKITHNIPGVWGPFSNILNDSDDFSIYEAGQSCTGKLIEHLFKSHPASSQLHNKSWPQLFRQIEECIQNIESETKCSIHLSTKHMFYYGDLEGNRTPYADPQMSGMFIGETTDKSFKDLVYKYVCVLEFIAFQIKHMMTLFNELQGNTPIDEINFCGSQAKNQRILNLITLLNKRVTIKVPIMNVSLMGVFGSYVMGKASSIQTSIMDVPNNETSTYKPCIEQADLLARLLGTKYDIYLDMAKQQKTYREKMDKTITDYFNFKT